MIKGLIFDMDGTVIDSTKSDFDSLMKAMSHYKIEFSYQDYIEMVGAKGEEIVAAKRNLSGDEIEKLLNRKSETFKELVRERGLNPVSRVEEFLLKIKEIPLWTALATGSNRDKVDFVLERVRVSQYFDIILSADDVDAGKPDPDIFLTAAKKLHLLPTECIVFEDAKMGIKAAKKAGMKCIAITTSSPAEMLREADLIIDSYDDPRLYSYLESSLNQEV